MQYGRLLHRQKLGRTWKLLAEELPHWWGRCVLSVTLIASASSGKRGRGPMWQMTSLLIGTYQGIPDWTIKVIFQERVETAFRSVILGSVSSALAQVTLCWACVFLFNSSNLFPDKGASHVNIWESVFSTERRASTEILMQEHVWYAPVGEDKEFSFDPSKC